MQAGAACWICPLGKELNDKITACLIQHLSNVLCFPKAFKKYIIHVTGLSLIHI